MTKAGFDIDETDIDTLFDIMILSIEHIYEGDKIYPAKDSTKEELKTFLESLNCGSSETFTMNNGGP